MFNLKNVAQKAEEVRKAEEAEKQKRQEETNNEILEKIEKLNLEPVAADIASRAERYINTKAYHCLYIDIELLNNMVVREPMVVDETKGTENVIRLKAKVGTEGGVNIAERVYNIIFKNLGKFFEDELKLEDSRSKNSRTIWLR
jgi:hypothetical protein